MNVKAPSDESKKQSTAAGVQNHFISSIGGNPDCRLLTFAFQALSSLS